MDLSYRRLKPNEHHPCFVGSGECKVNATHAADNGEGTGTEVFMCEWHRYEMESVERQFATLKPHVLEQLEAHIMAALKKQDEGKL